MKLDPAQIQRVGHGDLNVASACCEQKEKKVKTCKTYCCFVQKVGIQDSVSSVYLCMCVNEYLCGFKYHLTGIY